MILCPIPLYTLLRKKKKVASRFTSITFPALCFLNDPQGNLTFSGGLEPIEHIYMYRQICTVVISRTHDLYLSLYTCTNRIHQ